MPRRASHDPLDCLTHRGWRIAWLADYADGVLIFDDERIIVADPALPRRILCEALRSSVLGEAS